jgi:hypothetical protein
MNLSFSKPKNVNFFQKLNPKKNQIHNREKKNPWEKHPIFIQGSDDLKNSSPINMNLKH